jgi:hypothetical protein
MVILFAVVIAYANLRRFQGNFHEFQAAGCILTRSFTVGTLCYDVRDGQRRALAMAAMFRNAYAALRFGDGAARRPYLELVKDCVEIRLKRRGAS